MIHYCQQPSKPRAKTACGHVFDKCPPSSCLTDDVDSIDCEECLATNEFKAQSMERALIKPSPVPVRGATADFVHYDDAQNFEDI